jgi:D-citramalate synthase
MHYVKPLLRTNNGKEFKTRGLDSDQTVAAIIATQKC